METLFDVQQLLKQFGTFIYTGHKNADIALMMEEIQELHRNKMISDDDFRKALIILRSGRNKSK